MSTYEIAYLDEDDYDRWDGFVSDSPTGTLFHKSHWIRTVYGDFEVCTVKKGEELLAGLPLAPTSELGIRVLGHPSLTPYFGVVFKDMSQRKRVSEITEQKKTGEHIAAELKDSFDRVHLYTTPREVNLLPFKWAAYSFTLRYTYLLDVTDVDRVWDEMAGDHRSDIRRADRDGVTVTRTDDIETALDLVEKTYERQDRRFGARDTAREIHAVLSDRDEAAAFVARDDTDVPVAAIYLLWDGKRAYYLLGGYDDERGQRGATAMVLWRAIQYTDEDLGLPEFDFEGSDIPGIERFFRQFGGELSPYYGLRWSTPWLRPLLSLREQL